MTGFVGSLCAAALMGNISAWADGIGQDVLNVVIISIASALLTRNFPTLLEVQMFRIEHLRRSAWLLLLLAFIAPIHATVDALDNCLKLPKAMEPVVGVPDRGEHATSNTCSWCGHGCKLTCSIEQGGNQGAPSISVQPILDGFLSTVTHPRLLRRNMVATRSKPACSRFPMVSPSPFHTRVGRRD